MSITRRKFARLTALTGGALAVPWRFSPFAARSALAATPGGTLDPNGVPKFVSPLVKPPVFHRDRKIRVKGSKNVDYYEIAVKAFSQQILPPGMPMTPVWSYGPANAAPTLANGYFYPAFTFENKYDAPTMVRWVNGLGSTPHLLPVDQTLHWANPPGEPDTHGHTDAPYTGPVPIVTHVHGAHTYQESDGYPEAWYLADGSKVGSKYEEFHDLFRERTGMTWPTGSAVFDYPNDQRAATLWYHDHTLGMTRLNVYAGPAGFWLIRGGPDDMVLDARNGSMATLPGPAPDRTINPFGTFYEIAIAIQDRSFNADGTLFYPSDRAFFEGLEPSQLDIPFAGSGEVACGDEPSDVAPIWQPEFFGNMMVVNGQTWPYLDVEQRRYRFRLLNGCNSRFLILDFSSIPGVELWQIGTEGGFLPQPVQLTRLLMSPAERADVIVDFTNVPQGNYVLDNLGPDEPFAGGEPDVAFDRADPLSTGQVLQFRVGPALGADMTTPPQHLLLPSIQPLQTSMRTRRVSLNEEESKTVYVRDDGSGGIELDCSSSSPFGPTAALLGTVDDDGEGEPLLWSDEITENPHVGSTETWEIHNFTADAHPIHIHLVQFRVLGRQGIGGGTSVAGSNSPLPWETGFKDTVIAYPGEVTRVQARFDKAGLFVWHCHIVEHEDNEMMRPYEVEG